MMKKKIAKTLIRGKVTVLAVVVVATVMGTSSALAGTGIGGIFNLGQLNTVDAQSQLRGTANNALLRIVNLDTVGTSAKGLSIYVANNRPPLVVENPNSGTATNLSADKLDGKDSSAFFTGKTYRVKDLRQGSGNGTVEIRFAQCDAGDKLLGGGGGPEIRSLDPLIESRPVQGSERWLVKVQDNGSPDLIDAAAVCADFTP